MRFIIHSNNQCANVHKNERKNNKLVWLFFPVESYLFSMWLGRTMARPYRWRKVATGGRFRQGGRYRVTRWAERAVASVAPRRDPTGWRGVATGAQILVDLKCASEFNYFIVKFLNFLTLKFWLAQKNSYLCNKFFHRIRFLRFTNYGCCVTAVNFFLLTTKSHYLQRQ